MSTPEAALATADWRQRVFDLYSHIRYLASDGEVEAAHDQWRLGRDDLFANHPSSPLSMQARKLFAGLPVAAYDPAGRVETGISPEGAGELMDVSTGTDGVVHFERLGTAGCAGFGTLGVWRILGYGGGLFVPVRDATAGRDGGTYGGGRYVLDTIKGAHLGTGTDRQSLVIDFNFAYNPSCAYDDAWACPLPGPANRLDAELPFGEMANL